MKEHYTIAVLQLLQDDTKSVDIDAVLKNLKKVLESRGHTRLLPSILRSVAKQLEHASYNAPILTLVNASEIEGKKYQKDLEESGLQYDKDKLNLEEDKTIIGGFKLTVNGKMVDRSYKSQLLTIYRNITT